MTIEQKYDRKLVFRVVRIFITIIIVLILSMSYFYLTTLKRVFKSEFKKRGNSLCSKIAFNARYEVFIRDDAAIVSLLSDILREEDIVYAYIVDEQNKIIAFRSEDLNLRESEIREEIIERGDHVDFPDGFFRDIDKDLSVFHTSRSIYFTPEDENGEYEAFLTTDSDKRSSSDEMLGFAHIGMSMKRLNRRIAETERFIFISSILFLLFFSFVVVFFARSIVNPIIALVSATRKVAQGDLDFRAHVLSRDELGLLTHSFNKMTEDLKRSQDKILELNKNLEKKIDERTYELDRTNKQLRNRNEELQKLAAELEKSNKRIVEADRLKSEFLANMSHELRTPLNSIIGFSSLSLKEEEVDGLPSLKDNLEEIYKNGKQLLDIINDILDLSKVEAGKIIFVQSAFSVEDSIGEVLKTIDIIKEDKDIVLKTNIEKDLPIIKSDLDRVRQILLNIAGNAVKFTDKGYIEILAKRKGNYVQISVRDTGIGIKELDIPKVFESFRQIDGSSTRKEGGTGLGMTICKKFVELLGGSIWIESEYGKGTEVFFTLPLSGDPKHEHALGTRAGEVWSSDEKKTKGKNLVFIVEDDMSTIKLYEKILIKGGYDVIWQTTGKGVVDRIRDLQPFVIFLDIMLPDKNGWELLIELKSCKKCQNIPIVMSSVITEKKKGFALGAVEYLVKPVSEEALLGVLKRIRIKGKKIAIVDDSRSDVLLLTKMLADLDYMIKVAYDGAQGIELINTFMPHLILLDLMMPVIDGFQVIEKIRKRENTRNIPVVVMTAKDLTQEDKDFLNGKIDALIMKSSLSEKSLLNIIFDLLKYYDVEAG